MLCWLVGMSCLSLLSAVRTTLPSTVQLKDFETNDVIQGALAKCSSEPEPEKEYCALTTGYDAHVVESFLDLGVEETTGEVVGDNASASALSGRGSSSFVDFECTAEEMKVFRTLFGLDPVGLSNKRFGHNKICPSNNVVWIYPEADHNGAFEVNENVCHRLTSWSQMACSVHFIRVSSVLEASQFLKEFPANSIMHSVLGGHGTGKSMQWGSYPHMFGMVEDSGPVPVGRIVSWPYQINTLTLARPSIPAHMQGYVNKVDKDGDAFVYFRAGQAWVKRFYFSRVGLTTHSSGLPVVEQLQRAMQPHASIFLDSCSSATSATCGNLAQYVAQSVGKGVRVIGSEVSFGKVKVRTFSAWHASLAVHAQREYFAADASCPAFAKHPRPNAKGNCECKGSDRCRTAKGKLCPSAGGLKSNALFLPSCAEEWSLDRCVCDPAGPKLAEKKSLAGKLRARFALAVSLAPLGWMLST